MTLQRAAALLAGVSALALAACTGETSVAQEAPAAPVLDQAASEAPAGKLPEGVTPTAYRVDLVTIPEEDGFTGRVEIDVVLDAPQSAIWLHALGPRIEAASATLPGGEVVAARFTPDLAEDGVGRLDLDRALPAGAATLVLEYRAPYNFGLAGLYKATQSGEAYLASQMQPIDARRMVPSFDEPRFKTPWTFTVTAPTGDRVITNGPLVAQEDAGEGLTTHTFAATRPIQSYLLALAVGPYDERTGEDLAPTGVRDRAVPFRGFAAMGKGDKLQTAMDATEEMVAWQEAYFDYPYPYAKLDIIAVPDFAFGAMENAGAIIYREAALLVDERTALSRKRGVLTVHAHELAHQWFGNLVTPAWWDDIWLNEAFATWFSYKTMHAYDPEGGYDRAATRAALGAMGADSLANARQIRNPIARNADILDAFDAITYRKGGGVLAMFETYLGEEAFREGMRVHMQRFEDGVADVNDFMESLAAGSGQPGVVESFESFIYQPGIPYLDVDVSCPAPDAGLVTVTQTRYAPVGSSIDADASLWTLPFAARIKSPAGEVTVRQMLDRKVTEIPLDGACADWVMPNAGGTGYWRFTLNEAGWDGLLAGFDTLTPSEQLTLSNSLYAAFAAGDIPAGLLLEGLEVTTTGAWDAVSQPLSAVSDYRRILPDEAIGDYEAWVRGTWGPVYARLDAPGAAPDQGETLLRDQLYGLLLQTGRDPALREAVSASAAAYVGLEGEPDRDALSPEAFPAAMAVATGDLDDAFFDAALALALDSNDQTERATILYALAEHGAPERMADVFDTALSEAVSPREAFGMVLNAVGNRAARDTAWALVQERFADIAEKTPEMYKPALGRIAGAFCDGTRASEVAAFLETQAALIPGYERTLAQSVESARLCAAFREAKGAELAAALAGPGEAGDKAE